VFGVVLITALGLGSYWYYRESSTKQISSIAVMPFINETGNADVEYLSDGMTESLINSLSQLPDLKVKARSSVFRYKGKDIDPQQAGSELSVQAILNGRVVQRGDGLTLYLSLVDARQGNQIWGENYNRKMSDIVTLQSEIARDVSNKLRVKLSRTDEQKLAKSYTANPEAYQLYLKGRYHVLRISRPEIQTAISYYQQAIALDPSYALAYVGLADGYRALTLGGEMDPSECLSNAKAAAQKAVELDDTLAEAHSQLGIIIFWHDWDWNAAESECKRALELDPNSGDAHILYAHLLSNTGRHSEALDQAKRASELDPLNLRTGALEGQFLLHAGRVDEAIDRLKKIFELDNNYWFAHMFAGSAYIEKGSFDLAIAEAQKAKDTSAGSSQPIVILGYALAKAGKQAEARAVLEQLVTASKDHYVRPYNIALVYHGLGDNDNALAWLQRGIDTRDPFMTFLKVEPKWNDLRGDPRFQEIFKKVGLPG